MLASSSRSPAQTALHWQYGQIPPPAAALPAASCIRVSRWRVNIHICYLMLHSEYLWGLVLTKVVGILIYIRATLIIEYISVELRGQESVSADPYTCVRL